MLVNFLSDGRFSVTVRGFGWTAVFLILAVMLQRFLGQYPAKAAMTILRWRDSLCKIFTGVVMATIGFLFATVHIAIFDRAFLAMGRLKRVLEGQQGNDQQ